MERKKPSRISLSIFARLIPLHARLLLDPASKLRRKFPLEPFGLGVTCYRVHLPHVRTSPLLRHFRSTKTHSSHVSLHSPILSKKLHPLATMPIGIQRLNAPRPQPSSRIIFIKPLPGPTSAYALDFLERIAAICRTYIFGADPSYVVIEIESQDMFREQEDLSTPGTSLAIPLPTSK